MSERAQYTKEEQAANRGKWVAALRSDEYQQTTGRLRDENGYCCLGVACDVARSEGLGDWDGNHFDTQCGQEDQVLTRDVADWLGLANSNGGLTTAGADAFRGVEPEDFLTSNLAKLNDDDGLTFDAIADVIEQGKVRVQ